MNNKIRKAITCFVCGVFFIGGMYSPIQVNAEEREECFKYNGEEQVYTAPYSGMYQFELFGAQGGNSECEGGKGGKVTVDLKLNKNDEVQIVVGGQNGYNGGGEGNVANGGGATDIRINGERIAIAAGGGGGTVKNVGGAGGSGGDNENLYVGSDALEINGSAGGGGGYMGGTAGYYYMDSVYHSHSYEDNCYQDCSGWVWYEEKLESNNDTGETYYQRHYKCVVCGHEYASYKLGTEHPDYSSLENMQCTQRKTVCGISTKEPQLVERIAASKGGSNWYDSSSCMNAVCEEGVQTGDGKCCIKILSFHNVFYKEQECRKIFYGGVKVKKVYYNNRLIYKEE